MPKRSKRKKQSGCAHSKIKTELRGGAEFSAPFLFMTFGRPSKYSNFHELNCPQCGARAYGACYCEIRKNHDKICALCKQFSEPRRIAWRLRKRKCKQK